MKMEEDSHERMINPWLSHLQKLTLALKCTICRGVLNRPILLPCDHLFCNSCIHKETKNGVKCPACKTQYVDRETRPTPSMENVIAVYRSLCLTSLIDIFHPHASAVKDVAALSEQPPFSDITNHGIMEESVETSAVENSSSGKSMCFLNGSQMNTRIGLQGDPCGIDEDRSTQSQPPSQLRNGDLVEIAVKKKNINQMKRLSVGRTRSLSEIYKNAKRRKIPNSSETYDDKCGFCHSFEVRNEMLQYEKCAGTGTNPLATQLIPKQSDFFLTSSHGAKTWVFCGSALSSINLCYLVKFARCCGATVARFWRPDITHVITATNANGSCMRTLKVLMAILYGQWIISMDWIKSCVEADKLVDEEPYEVILDNHGARDGPKTGRHLALDNGPKLFGSLIFYFSGDFDSALMNDLKTLVLAAGGTLIENKEHLASKSCVAKETSRTLIVYNADHIDHCVSGDKDSHVLEIPETPEELALRIGSRIIQHTWILESIAACKLQPLSCY